MMMIGSSHTKVITKTADLIIVTNPTAFKIRPSI